MMRELLRREEVPRRLLAFPDGERRLTNLFHLVELLQADEDAAIVGMTGLIHWLVGPAARRDRGGRGGPAPPGERREPGEDRHHPQEQGAGIPHRLLPFPVGWPHRRRRCGDRSGTTTRRRAHRPTLDLGRPGMRRRKAQARREELAESLRLAYVALTRAKHRCYTVWGHVRDGATAPLAYLLHQPPDLGADPMDAVEAHVGSLGSAEIRADLDRMARLSGGTITVRPIPQEAPRAFPAPVDGAGGLAGPRLHGESRRALADRELLGARAGIGRRGGLDGR